MLERELVRALAAHSDEEAAARAGGVGGGDGEVRAADDAELGAGVDDEREADGVLLAAQEALRAVDRVEASKPEVRPRISVPQHNCRARAHIAGASAS